MADLNVGDILKQFAQKITTASVKERQKILGDVATCLTKPDLPEAALKGILKHLQATLGRYHDRRSRRAADNVVQSMAQTYPSQVFKLLVGALSDLAAGQTKSAPCVLASGMAHSALNWCTLAVRIAAKSEDDMKTAEFKKLVGIQCHVLYGSLAAQKTTISRSAFNRLKRVWKEVPGSLSAYVEGVRFEGVALHHMCMLGMMTRYLAMTKQQELLAEYKGGFIEDYVKVVIMTRTKPAVHLLISCRDLLRHVTHEEFRAAILPALDKAMLRNPEIILQVLSDLLAGLSIDVSQYAVDISKHLATQLHSKEDDMREIAAEACGYLARQISDPAALEKLVKHFFAVLNGSEGKLTVIGQRQGMLTGIGKLSQNGSSGTQSVHALSTAVVEFFMPLLQQEMHEGTLVHILAMLSLWTAKFSHKVPEKFTECLKTGMGLKSSTSAVRHAYLQCMNVTYAGDRIVEALSLLPVLMHTLEKAYQQPAQIHLVTEAAAAAVLLTRLALPDIGVTEAKLTSFWNIIQDTNKQLFTNDKFLSSSSDQGLKSVASLVERLILDHPQQMQGTHARQYHYAFVYILSHGPYEQRRFAISCAKKILSALGGTSASLSLLAEFAPLLQSYKSNTGAIENGELGEGSGDPPGGSGCSRMVADALKVAAYVPGADRHDAMQIALATLFNAHHPIIVQHDPDTWINIVASLKLDAVDFITQNMKDIMREISTAPSIPQAMLNTVATISRVAPTVSIPNLIEHICDVLGKSALATVTSEEYQIMLTPEGEIFDKSVLGSATKTDNVANMKRENKLYSYAEQMAELELRKEIAKKKGKPLNEEPVLTKKQQELMAAQLEKESVVRASLKELDQELINVCLLIDACLIGNKTSLRCHLPVLLSKIIPLMSSPLAAPRLSSVFIDLRSSALDMNNAYFEMLLSQCTLRLLKPMCALAAGWQEEPLDKQVKRAVSGLQSRSVPSEGGEPLLASSFSYIFYLLKAVLGDGGSSVGGDQAVLIQCLKIISAHAQVRVEPGTEEENSEVGAELLPRTQMLSLLVKVIGQNAGRPQQMGASGLLDVAMAGSGLEGCAAATQEEIDVLLKALQSPAAIVREAALQSLLALMMVLPMVDTQPTEGMQLLHHIWVMKFDPEEDNKKLANRLWEELGLEFDQGLCGMLVDDIIHDEEVVRVSAADALSAALQQSQDSVDPILSRLLDVYQEKLYIAPPILDSFGRIMIESPPDQYAARCGVAMAMQRMSPYVKEEHISNMFEFFVQHGLRDRSSEVRQHMLDAAVAAVNEHGKANCIELLAVFEDFLAEAPDNASYDSVRQSVVILMGSLAKHLDKDDPKVKPIVAKLIETLSTPSQQVQEAVAGCLPPLVPAIKADAPELVQRLLQLLLESENYGERKGAAYGLAGLIKGFGILALKQLEIMATLQNAIQNKKNPRYREGALFAFEMLCTMLGRLFEPYVVHILPHLLLCFGDNNQYVREAADDTAKAVMSKLSAHGVKLVLPSLLSALEEDSWRTKTGSVELLGAMAFCAPKQLSACLPSIVPKLMEVLTDSHIKVQNAGNQALKQIGSVIKNPEIQAIVPNLLDALQDPNRKTTSCLQNLLDTKFVHFIDAPSLALIMPVVQRAFQDRSTETRKMAAQIIGNMYSLTDQKDLSPYLPNVIPGLKQSLLDPVPEVRTVAARALGAIVRGMGESGFEDLLPWLMQTLTSEQSSVDRSGAAQGLSEVVGGLGIDKLNQLMPNIIATAERSDIQPHVRDGYIMMFIYLPGVFGDDFVPYVGPIIPSILKALADENEYVRDTALRAGQRIVNMYADKSIELLLPQLESGLFDDNWRIRYSSVQLLGDLLYKVSGVSGKMSTEGAGDDDNFGTETSQKAIFSALGDERRNRVLAGLYMGRSDTALMVRQASLHVWKIIVTHTPKTLREILSTLFSLLLGCLASPSYDKRQVAARTLGDVARKLGEKVLPEIIPILEKGLESERSDQRQGVCIGLSEIMASTSKDHVIVFADSLIPTVRKALCDPLPEVREAAAKTFDNLHSNIGSRALDDILPNLLEKLDDGEIAEFALDGLRQVMAVKSRVVLPYLVPQLTAHPVNMRALSFLSSVAGEALTKHLPRILPALMLSLSEKQATPDEAQELEYCQSVILSVNDELGIRCLMDELLVAMGRENGASRWAAVMLLFIFCQHTKSDYSEHVPQLFRGILSLFTDTDEAVLQAGWDCLNAIVKKLDSSEMLLHITNMRQAVRFATSDFKEENLPGFCLPKKGIAPIWLVYREGILSGTQELKETAAIGLGDVIRRTSADALKSSVVSITGPLIRILGDRFTFSVKVAVLETLGLLLGKCGGMLKPFLPQLQTTFLKALNDPNRSVRLKAATALGKLIIIHTRVDPLFTELHTAINTTDDVAVRDTTLQALRGCLLGAGKRMSDPIRKQITATLQNFVAVSEDTTRITAAACLGALCAFLPPDELSIVLNLHLLDADPSEDWIVRHGRAVGLMIALKEAAERLLTDEYCLRTVKAVHTNTTADRIPLCMSGLRAAGFLLGYQVVNGEALHVDLIQDLIKSMKQESNDVKILSAQVVSYIAKCVDHALDSNIIKMLVPMLVNGTKEKNTIVRCSSESALVAMLRIRHGDSTMQAVLDMLEPGQKDALNEVTTKVLRKVANQPDTLEDIDDTVLV